MASIDKDFKLNALKKTRTPEEMYGYGLREELETQMGVQQELDLSVLLPFTPRQQLAFNTPGLVLIPSRLLLTRGLNNCYSMAVLPQDGSLMRQPLRALNSNLDDVSEPDPLYSEIDVYWDSRNTQYNGLMGRFATGEVVAFKPSDSSLGFEHIPDALYFMRHCLAVATESRSTQS